MSQYDAMPKPELIKVLQGRGHKFPFLCRQTIQQLRSLADSGKEYDDKDRTKDKPRERNQHEDNQQQQGQQPQQEDQPQPQQQQPQPVAPAQPQQPGSATDALLQALTRDLVPEVLKQLKPQLDAILQAKGRDLTITIPNKGTVQLGLAHKDTEHIAKLIMGTKRPMYVYGPAGSGKSTLAKLIAKIIGAAIGRDDMPFESSSFGPASQLHELTGIPAIGDRPWQDTPFARAWSDGGVLLLDELDAAPELFVQLNAALANGYMIFANGQRVPQHPECYIIAAGNTIMSGATDHYTSRARQDKATVDRFVFWPLGYDLDLETAAAGTDQVKWTKHVQQLRRNLSALGANAPDLLITPRASIMGAEILRAIPSMSWNDVEDMVIWRGLSDDEKQRVRMAKATS